MLDGTDKLYVNLNLLSFYYNLYLCLRDMFDCEFETTYKVVWVFNVVNLFLLTM